MRHVGRLSIALLTLLILTGAAPSDPRRQTILIRSNDVVLHADSDTTLGQYYTVAYALPENLESADVDQVLLEMYVNVVAKPRQEQINESPVLEVYALRQPHGNRFDLENLVPEGRVVRPVPVGPGRRVVFDITRIVRANLDGTAPNNGLIIGSLTGMREGEFLLASDRLADGAVGRLVVYRRLKFVPAEVMSESKRPSNR